MELTLLFWIYLANAILLINHEIDSAYWQEWKLINPKDKHGINGFLILHFPILFVVLYGLVLVEKGLLAGLIISLFLGASGIFAFFFHFYHIRRGRHEFNTLLSKSILFSTLIISVVQVILTILVLNA
jgi:hypothetical protein